VCPNVPYQPPQLQTLRRREFKEIQMQKAHWYEAILLVNRGIDDAVRGLLRLKRAKDSGLKPGYFDEN
jgi:hypothetical protein